MAEASSTTSGGGNAAPEGNPPPPKTDALDGQQSMEDESEQVEDTPFAITVVLPHDSKSFEIPVSPLEQIHEIRQSIIEHPLAIQYSCFHLEHKGKRINDFAQVSDVEGLASNSELHVVEDPYTEKEARIHLIRVRELIGAAGDRTDTIQGILAGVSVYDDIPNGKDTSNEKNGDDTAQVDEYDFSAPPSLSTLLPQELEPKPQTVRSISLSPWNPPPAPLRQKGHLLYLQISTNENEQFHITAHVGGFFVNKSSNAKFDPFPKGGPKAEAAHSLFTLLLKISPSFEAKFGDYQDYCNRKDPLATFQIGNAFPSAPWIVPSSASTLCTHSADLTRTQETFLLGGAENTDSLRDWNEEFQSAKELPRDTIQDRVFRERLLSKLYADYNDAATRGAVLVARGEVAPLNPTEGRDAQIFVYNNVFFSFGTDGVGTFTSEGGDEAARVATGKDVLGVKLVNQLDIDSLYTPGTVVVDYLGKRIVGQSIVPGIFKQPEPGENQIHYGAVDGKDVVAADERFAASFEKLAQALRVKKHSVWDKDNKRFDLEASVEMKGLLGTDGRKYVLDLYRITPLDIAWMEESSPEGADYPHRMTVLRPELIETMGKQKARDFLNTEMRRRKDAADAAESKTEAKNDGAKAKDDKKPDASLGEGVEETAELDRIDMSGFNFSLNPDVFSGQEPQTDAEKAEMAKDEDDVREACAYLRETIIPGLLRDLEESDISFPMDGRSLTRLLHRRGINMRYLGLLATLGAGTRADCLTKLCVREMIARSFKHVAAKYLKYLPLSLTSACFSHLFNCLLGAGVNPNPSADIDESLKALFSDTDLAFEQVTPESLRADIQKETLRRYRYALAEDWSSKLMHLQLLRDISLKLGLQLQLKNFVFTAEDQAAQSAKLATTTSNGNAPAESTKKNKKKKARDASPASVTSTTSSRAPHTFSPDDFVNVVPLIKDSCPRSALAEEALEAGRLSIYQNQRKLGEDLLLESLSLHEQIYGLVHPEVAQMYHTLSQLYYQLDQKDAAIELARKAAIVSERTVGLDSAETVLNYLNLSLFLHQRGASQLALAYAKHALDLWKIIYGPDHPDTITTMNNYAVMLQSIKAYHESRRWFEESLRVCETVFGKNTVNSATLLFQLAQALALDQDPKGAMNRMRESYSIFKNTLGDDDKNTQEANHWLEQLTANAVSLAKHARDVELRKSKPSNFRLSSTSTGTGKQAEPKPASETPVNAVTPRDTRSIESLLHWIEAGEQKQGASGSRSNKKNAGRGNPKRRGGSTA